MFSYSPNHGNSLDFTLWSSIAQTCHKTMVKTAFKFTRLHWAFLRDNKLWISSTFASVQVQLGTTLTLSAESKIITFNYRALFFEVNLWFIKNQTRAHTVQKKSLMKTRASHIHTFCNAGISSGGKYMLLSSVITSFFIHENQWLCMRKIETERCLMALWP